PGRAGGPVSPPGHAPFVGLLGAAELRFHAPDGRTPRYFLAGGVVQTVDDVVTVLAEQVAPAESVDRAKAEADLARAIATKAVTDAEVATRDRAIASARARIRVADRRDAAARTH